VALRYALRVVGRVDGLAVTNLDRMADFPEWQVCDAYQFPGPNPSGVADFFECQGALCKNIRLPAAPTDLSKMEQLTRLLMQMQPVYRAYAPACPRQPAEYAAHIGACLGLPLAVTSYGPTASDKLIAPMQAA